MEDVGGRGQPGPNPLPGRAANTPTRFVKGILGCYISLLQLLEVCSEKDEGWLNPSLATPLSGPAVPGTSGVPGLGLGRGSRSPRRRSQSRRCAVPAAPRAADAGRSRGCVRSTRDCTPEPSTGAGENLRCLRAFRVFKNLR